MTANGWSSPPANVAELEDRLSTPSTRAVDAMRGAGDVVILGAGGKMGPSLARMVIRAVHAAGASARVFAVSRFADRTVAKNLEGAGCEVVRCDLTDPASYALLPNAPNVIFMAGRKFGTTEGPGATWQTNVVVPALVARRYRGSRIVAFSTGNVYPLAAIASGGSRESDAPGPMGEYAWSCLGRERVLTHVSETAGTSVAVLRLNYAVDLRYGVLVDVAWRVKEGDAVDLSTGYVNCIWQGDANAVAIAALGQVSTPPLVINVTGTDVISIREVAEVFGRRFARAPRFAGTEAPTALLSNARRMEQLFGATTVGTATLIDWVAQWVSRGGERLAKPTQYEQRGGAF